MSAAAPLATFTAGELPVAIYPDRASMGSAAAEAAAQAIASCKNARVILASAPSQDELLDGLAASEIDWSRVTLFHMDEYAGLPADHPASFRAYQQRRLLSRIRPKAFHGLRGESPDLAAESDRYLRLLTEETIDVVCLGIGENGHLAFNDPPADFSEAPAVKLVELDAACRRQQVNDSCFASLDAVPRRALTLNVAALLQARFLFCVVPGERKAVAVRSTLVDPISPQCPASILRTVSGARLYLDRASASLLPAL